MNPEVDLYIRKLSQWQEELEKLRGILLGCQFHEEYKWDSPCYSYMGKNIIGMRGFKNYCALWFFKGALLDDSDNIFMKPGEETKAIRHIRFTSTSEIRKVEQILKRYIFEAIEVEKAGLKFEFKKDKQLVIPEEFQAKLNSMPELRIAFFKLTQGRQRDYANHFAEPKLVKTRESRIGKCIPQILTGKGLNDKYIC